MPEVTQEKAIVAVYCGNADAQAGLKELCHAGVDLLRLSIIASDVQPGKYDRDPRYCDSGTRGTRSETRRDAMLSAARRAAPESMHIDVPSIGRIVILGSLVSCMRATSHQLTTAGKAAAFVVALLRIGIPPQRIFKYATDVKAGKLVMVASGNSVTIEHTRATLRTTCVAELTDYQATPLPIARNFANNLDN
jgi:hypothetical protein